MKTKMQSSISKNLSKLDALIRIAVDKILPKNLTIRYIAALIAVAALAISGQLIIQTSLSRQTEDQRRIRLLEKQIHDSENLRKAFLSLQLSSRESQVKIQIELIESLVLQFQKNAEILKSQGVAASEVSGIPIELSNILKKAEIGLVGVIEKSQILSATTVSILDQQLGSLTSELLNFESTYRSGLIEVSRYYEQRLEEQVIAFKRIELLLLFTTLLVLAIEALYVFRPAVESLYDALRIRSDFLGRMGHEMRNPMNSIIGMTNLLFETPLTDQQQKYLSILRKSSSGLLEVLNNLLDFSSLESGTIKMESITFDFYKLLEKSIDLAVFGAHANGIELILDLGANVPLKLCGDPFRIQQILANLLGNAVKFTKKGEVTLQIALQRKNGEAWIQFSVIDTGMGIEKEKISRIFDAFVQEDSTVRRRFGGTGLGLSISKDLVSLLGGTLCVESQKNQGSRFYFTLPFPIVDEVTVEDTIRQLNFGDFQAILLEPNESITHTLIHLIHKSGGKTSRVVSTIDQLSILQEITQDAEKKEVVIIDYEFSKDALKPLFSKIRRGELKTDPFVFLIKTTASSSDIEHLAEYGLRNFIFKPIKPLQLLDAIRQGLSGQLTNFKEQNQPLIHDSRPLRVLAVDDSKDNQFLVKAYFATLPYRLTFADHGRDAVEKFKAAQFDIVLMDLQMPEMDGYTATQLIREWEESEKLPSTPVVAVSAHDDESGTDRFRKAQFSSYLVKPISPNQLRRAILDLTQHLPETGSSSSMDELEKQLSELAPQYLENRRQELGHLKQILLESNFEKIQTLGHRLKGNAKSYGFEELGLIGASLEEAAHEKDVVQIQALIVKTENYLSQFNQN